ncbi:MAG: hypothetical protein ABL996_20740 [Micropepsaceae bacterium]
MRTIAFLFVLAQLVSLGPLFLLYGQVDPCRALAKEIASRAEAAGGLGVAVDSAFGDLEIDARRDIADNSTGECVGKLFTSWTERVTG